MNLVYDSSALIALISDEPGADVVKSLLSDRSNVGIVHAINMCEVFYDTRRNYGEEAAKAAYAAIMGLGLIVHEAMGEDLWQAAARLKADYRRVSLADCICAALANQVDGDVITCDRHEIGPLAEAGVCRVRFIR